MFGWMLAIIVLFFAMVFASSFHLSGLLAVLAVVFVLVMVAGFFAFVEGDRRAVREFLRSSGGEPWTD